MELGSCLGRPSSVVGWRTCNDLAGSRSLYAQRGPCRQSCGEDGPSAHRRSSGSSRHDATNWRGGTADAPWFQTMVATLASSSSQTQVAETSPWGLLDGRGGVHGKASAQTHTKQKNLVAFLKHRLQGLQKVASSFRLLFCGHAYSAKYEQVSKNGRPFSN